MKLFFKALLFGVPIGITFVDVVGYVARVDGVSMQPALNPASGTDYVFLNRWAVRFYDVSRGDVVALISPKDPDQKLIKRIVGLEGDIINTHSYKTPFVRVPEGHCWIEGDHTGHSMDSNLFGPVSLGLITAKATAIVWPPSRWQEVESFLPASRAPIQMRLEE
ncbi:Mitochondrial inner membrane protease subunit 2 [Homalodisca vitripennis]|uniref:Mitochondrial inner membrane protease subunit n=1 Tax=Homalodisca liturata TaxID=320908 RepID=A0A1B6HAG0_9HEMI|nr:Mitochondrial inner membrane protease subunit 2 [Homalodisca vitripennis]KAG8287755.1 Mitochondrial inner membrane protease subunit 2 [Homalodisca vitripennis]